MRKIEERLSKCVARRADSPPLQPPRISIHMRVDILDILLRISLSHTIASANMLDGFQHEPDWLWKQYEDFCGIEPSGMLVVWAFRRPDLLHSPKFQVNSPASMFPVRNSLPLPPSRL